MSSQAKLHKSVLLEPLHNRCRLIAVAGTASVHLAMVAALLSLAPEQGSSARQRQQEVIAIRLTQPAVPPLPRPTPTPTPTAAHNVRSASSQLPSRYRTEALSVVESTSLLTPEPINPVEPLGDLGASGAGGFGETKGDAAGQGTGSSSAGSGQGGTGSGSGLISPPVRIAGDLTQEDYRRANPPRGASGVVVVSYRVRTNGRVDSCQVLSSSGFSVFDIATCRLIQQRFRFRPARDAAGRELEWEVRTNYQWILR